MWKRQSRKQLVRAENNMKQNFKGTPLGLIKLLVTKSPWKVMKNAFCFTFKALFVLKTFKVLSWLFCLIRMRRLISKFMASQPWKQTIAIQMLPIISNQAIKFGQLRENNMSNISLEKAYTKYDGKTIARPFSKNWNWVYFESIV